MTKLKNGYFSILLSALPAVFTACEKEIWIDQSGFTPKIVLNGIISPDSLIEIRVGKSFLYTDTLQDKSLLKDASLTLSINGQEREKMRMIGIDTTYRGDYMALSALFHSTLRPNTGDHIRIDASAEGFEPVRAETTIPLPPEINRVDTSTFFTAKNIFAVEKGGYNPYLYPPGIKEEELYRNMRVKMSVTGGSPGANQYFLLQAGKMTEKIRDYTDPPEYFSYLNQEYLILYTDDDPIFEEDSQNSILEDLITEGPYYGRYYDSALFSGKLFRDNRYTLDFSVTDYYYILTTYEEAEGGSGYDYGYGYYPGYTPFKTEVIHLPLEVQLTAISPELYPRYRRRYYSQNDDMDALKLISEPETTYSNVRNGLGIVGAVSPAKIQIDIPPFPGGENRIPKR